MARTGLGFGDVRELCAYKADGMAITDAALCGDDEKTTPLKPQYNWGMEESMRKDGTVVLRTELRWDRGCRTQIEVHSFSKDVPTWARRDTGLWWDMKHLGDRGMMSSVDGIMRMR